MRLGGSFRYRCLVWKLLPINALLILALPTARACTAIADNQTLKPQPNTPFCLTVRIEKGHPAQISFAQPRDIAIESLSFAPRSRTDAFEFGDETITLIEPGEYTFVIRAANSHAAAFSSSMSRRALPLQEAEKWREAETIASAAKTSGKSSELAASVESWRVIGHSLSIARALLQLGDAHLAAPAIVEARAAYESALEFCRAAADTRCEAEAANNSGFAAQQSGDFTPALNRLNEAASLWRQTGEIKSAGITLSNIALLYWYTNDFERAISTNDRAAQNLVHHDPLAHAIVMNNLGLCYQSLAQYSQAAIHFQRALAVESTRPDGAHAAVRARLNLGRNRMLQGDTAAAQLLLTRAVNDATRLSDRRALADALCNLGQNLLELRRPVQARTALEESLSIHKALSDKRMELADLNALGRAAAMRGNEDAARAYLSEAIELGRLFAFPDGTSEALYSMAVLHASAGRLAEARAFAERALRLLESIRAEVPGPELRASYYSRKRRLFDLLVGIEMQSGSPAAGLIAAERGRARSMLDIVRQGSVSAPGDPELAARRARVQREIGLRSYELAKANTPVKEDRLRAQVEGLISESEEIDARLGESSRLPVATPIDSVESLQRDALPSGYALIEYHLADPYGFLWLVDRTSVRSFRMASRSVVEAEARKVIELFPRVLDRRRSPALQASFDASIRRLSNLLLGSLRNEKLPARLVIVPDGILNAVPFAALPGRPGSVPLGLGYDLIQAPSASFLRVASAAPPHFTADFLGIVDPVYSATDSRLKGRARAGGGVELPRLHYATEIETVSTMVPPSRRTLLRDFAASPTALLRLHLGDYALIHFSTHALIDDRIPELSTIALSMFHPDGTPADGFLHTYDFSGLHLNGSTVVLSACETALGKQVIGEGLAGLTAALFEGGASRLVLSLSAVDDEASSVFFSKTYGHFLGSHPKSMEHSLTLARTALAHSLRWADPYYWASFILVARPDARL